MRKILLILALVFAVGFTTAQIAFAATDSSTVQEPAFGEIIWQDAGRNGEGNQLFAMKISLKEGWKTYWRFPGQNGLNPQFDLSDSINIAEYEIYWPEPKLVGDEGIEAIGYLETVTLLFVIKPKDLSQDVELNLNVDLGVCEHICVPIHREFHQRLSPDYSISSIELELLRQGAFDETACKTLNGDLWYLFINDGQVQLLNAEILSQIKRVIPPAFIVNREGMSAYCTN